MIKRRCRTKQTSSLHDRLSGFADHAREKAESLPPGPRKQLFLEKAREAQTAADLDEWIRSPGLVPPE